MAKVVFAVPTYGRAPALEFQMSALDTQMQMLAAGISTVWRYLGGDPYVHKARNKLASEFLTDHPDATHLFFLDDDLGWSAAAAVAMMQRDEDVVVGVYPKKNDAKIEWPVEMASQDGQWIRRDGLYRVALAPTGFMRIKRHVLEAIAADSGQYPDPDKTKGWVTCWDMFRTGFVPHEPGGKIGRWWGEDFFFSALCNHLGFEIWAYPDVAFTHRGSKAWGGNFADHLEAHPCPSS